ncbi:MAG: divalent cation transporter [Pseudomonadota bacterium]
MVFGLLYALLAGAMIPLGALLAAREPAEDGQRRAKLHHAVTAFAGGALMSAVALVLVPEGSERLSTGLALASFVFGGVLFAGMDAVLAKRGGGRGQLVAMVSDFLPEAVALGALLAMGADGALVVAAIIGLQNLPEGYNSFLEAAPEGREARRSLLLSYCGLALLGPLAAYLGFTVFSEAEGALGVIMMAAAGGILYLVFEDVAPKVAPQDGMDVAFAPALGAVLGFSLGLLGHLLSS